MQGYSLQQTQTLRQEQILAPQQIQSLEILLAALPELERKIGEELLENPTLELLKSGNEDLVGNPVERATRFGDDMPDMGDSLLSQKLESAMQLQDLWQDRLSMGGRGGVVGRHTEDDEEKRRFFFDSLVSEPSVQENLLNQMRELMDVTDEDRRICEEIIGSIDDKGYLRSHPADIAIACGLGQLEPVERCLKMVQTFDPPGIGARDLRECLMLQLERLDRKQSLAFRIVDKYLDDVARNRLEAVCKKARVSPPALREALQEIRRLYPHPGALIAPSQNTDFIAPEVFIEKDDKGKWIIRSNHDSLPRLRISAYYLNMLRDAATPPDVKNYIRQKISDSKVLMRAIEQRESTIVRISRSLLKYQADFFDEGLPGMKPLTMSQVADDIQVHETTVSRAIANKYMMTPHGLLSFRHFFTSGYTASDGQEVSSLVVKERIRHFVGMEPSSKPLSDQKLSDMLKEEGYAVARRTIAKYREELGIPPSSLRRGF
ncbi:MAG: RNA polymerase factor sigma-54 [Lentisphaeria bacterium]|nr:RNA polymerase factor sigma-54 [Lentisphaeria bacterium]